MRSSTTKSNIYIYQNGPFQTLNPLRRLQHQKRLFIYTLQINIDRYILAGFGVSAVYRKYLRVGLYKVPVWPYKDEREREK